MKRETYKSWPLFEDMPNGWRIDKTCGSPLAGYVFISDGKSIINGGKRALLRVRKAQMQISFDSPAISKMETAEASSVMEPAAEKSEQPYPARTVNELAREQFKLRLLNDIRCDLIICELEGWGKMEYINEIRRLINEIGSRVTIDT